MKRAFRIIGLALCAVAIVGVVAGCSRNAVPSKTIKYQATAKSGEEVEVAIKQTDAYSSENPTASSFVILDESGQKAATLHLVSKESYDSYQQATKQLSSYKEVKHHNLTGFQYDSPRGADADERLYACCLVISENTSAYVDSEMSYDVLNEVIDLLYFTVMND